MLQGSWKAKRTGVPGTQGCCHVLYINLHGIDNCILYFLNSRTVRGIYLYQFFLFRHNPTNEFFIYTQCVFLKPLFRLVAHELFTRKSLLLLMLVYKKKKICNDICNWPGYKKTIILIRDLCFLGIFVFAIYICF